MREALTRIESGEDLAFVLVYMALLIDALLDDPAAHDEARRCIERALGYAAAGQQLYLPEIYRLRGELARRTGHRAQAHADFLQARALAERQGAGRLAERAAASAARTGEA
jgi:hypothetical protein